MRNLGLRGQAIVTIKDIAKKAGVSIGTVDRVLHRRGRVHPETLKRVSQVIKELDYRTNIFAKNLKLRKVFKFGVLMPRPGQDSLYWTLPLRGIERAQQELFSHKVQVNFFFFDRYQEKSVLLAGKKMWREKLDGLLAAPVLPKSFGQILQELPENLPVIFFDSYVPGIKPLSFIGQDAFQSGVLASCLMKQTVHCKQGKIAVIKVLPEDYHIAERIEGFLKGSCNWPGFESVVTEIDGHWSVSKTKTRLEDFYRKNKDIAGIFVANAMTHKVAEWWSSNSGKQPVILIGYDPIPRNVKLLKEKVIDFLISQQSERQGYEGIYALFRHVVLGEKVKEKIMMQIDIITAENVDYYQS
ncbi:MAG: substrate-binding domain-containing protein [Candidatus Saccharicenans sp.]|nr:MAG: LacI family transcriptional regulator [Candidatus Aminicenantes bacterium]HEK85552.1 LacI family DNA-binding transcriptional regulator [Candidatus Aminicenantes bacterium]